MVFAISNIENRVDFVPLSVIQRIETKRKELNLTVKQLSERSGIPESTYNNMVYGTSKSPSYDRLRALAICVDLSPLEFMEAENGAEADQEPESLQKPSNRPVTQYDFDYFLDAYVHNTRELSDSFREATRSRTEAFQESLAALQRQFEKERAELLAQITTKDKWMRRFFAAMCVVTLLCLTILMIYGGR